MYMYIYTYVYILFSCVLNEMEFMSVIYRYMILLFICWQLHSTD